MALLFFAALAGLSVWLGFRLRITTTENIALRSQVASLKRQLTRLR